VLESLCRGRKEIYEELYPDTKKGAVNQYTKVLSAETADSKPSFVADTSTKTGKSQRAIEKERAKERQGYRKTDICRPG
jgi:hypothetical protein